MEHLSIEEQTLKSLQSFDSVEEMNEMVKWHKQKDQINETDRAILDAISRYACKYTGVCFLSKQKIAEDAGFKTRRTAIRACNRMEKLGIVKQFETRRVSGDRRRSSNIIVIQHDKNILENREVNAGNNRSKSTESNVVNMLSLQESQQKVTVACHSKEALNKTPIKANTYKDTCEDTGALFKNALKNSIPEPFYDAFSPFFDVKGLYNIYGVLLRAKAYIGATFMLEDYAERYIDHFHNAVRLYKWGRVNNLSGYLYVTWERLTAEICRQITFGSY